MANPTIGATTPRIQYTATASQTVFTVPFEFLANADLAVYVNGTLKTLTTDYTLTGANTTGGGTLTFVTGRTAGEIVTILGNLAYSRDTNKYTRFGLLPAEVLEADFDAMQVQAKQLALADQFALRLPMTDSGSAPAVLPAKASRANTLLGFDANGAVTVILSAANDVSTAISAAQAAQVAAEAAEDSATISAAAAAVSASSASTSATAAAASASSASSSYGLLQAAADAALAANKIYATTAAGLAAVSSGEYFYVPSADSNESLILYLDSSGTAVEQKRLVNLASVATDPAKSSDIETTVDSLSYVGSRLTTRGRVSKEPEIVQPLAWGGKVMHHFIDYGQSLSNGWNSVPVITTSGMFDDTWMFNGGVNTAATSENPAVSMTSITPYYEQVQGTSGETPNGGRVARFVQLLRERHGKSLRDAGLAILCSSAGKDGAQISALGKPSTYYTRIINQVTQGKALAEAAGYTYRIAGIFFDQGQFDHATAVATYLSSLQTLQSNLQTDIRAITGGSETVRFFLTTPWWNVGLAAPYSHPGSTLGHLAAHTADPSKFIIAGTPYQQNTIDGTHWSAFESGLAGAYGADAYMEEVIYGGRFQCVEPLSFNVSTATITVRFSSPGGKLVFDTTQVQQAPNYGFVCTDRSGTAYTINSVALSGTDRVVITLSGAPGSGLRVKYGDFSTQTSTWGYVGPLRRSYGNRGNLRDNSGDISGNVYRHASGRYATMHRWCVQFDQVVIA